jgi:hypothetical protein
MMMRRTHILATMAVIKRIMMFPDLPKNEQNKNEKNNKKEIKFDFGSL